MSNESSSCRIDCHPSRLLCVALAGLGALAAIAVALSAIPLGLRIPLALLALWHGLRLARQEWRQPPRALEFDRCGGEVQLIEGAARETLADPQLCLRGALATLAWRDVAGRRRSLRWFADSLPRRSRRQLRLRFAAGMPGK